MITKNKKIIAASTFVILSALATWGGSNINSIPLKEWNNCGCAYGQCGCLQITLPPIGYTVHPVTPLVTVSNGTFAATSIYAVTPSSIPPTKIPTLPVKPSVTGFPTSNAGQLTAAAPTTTRVADYSILTSIAQTAQVGKTANPSTPIPTATFTPIPVATNTPNPLFTPTPLSPTQTPIPNAYYFNEANTWVDFWPDVGTSSLKRYDIINGLSGHVERTSNVGDFPNSRLIRYQYGQDVALLAGQVFECERWTKGWGSSTEAIVVHNFGSSVCATDRNKFSSPANIPTGTGVNYPIWNLDQPYAQSRSYDTLGREEYTTLIPLNKSVSWMNDILSPIHTAPKMFADCLMKAVRCMTMLQIYSFYDQVGIEEVIYISGMPYGGNNPSTQSFKDYLRNGELAFSKYRIIGNPSSFPHPSNTQAFVDAIITASENNLFTGEYYIYDGEYEIDGVDYDDVIFASENKVQLCSFSNIDTFSFASGNPLATHEYNVSLSPSIACSGTHQFICIYNDQYMDINAQLWYKKHPDTVNDVFCTKINSRLLQCDANMTSQGLVHFSTYYNVPINSNYAPNKPVLISMDGPISCDPNAVNPPLTPPPTFTPVVATSVPVPTNTPVIVPTSIPGVLCPFEPDELTQPSYDANHNIVYNRYSHPQCNSPHYFTKICIDWTLHQQNNLPYLNIYQWEYLNQASANSDVVVYCNIISPYKTECEFKSYNANYTLKNPVEILFRGDPVYPNGTPATNYFFLPNDILKDGGC